MTLDGDKLLTTYQRTLAAVSIVATGCGGLGPEDLARIELSAGNGQIATVGTPVDVPPAVKAVDEKGQPIPGATVTFTVTSGGGSVESAEAMSGKDGIATIGGWTLGPITGENVLTASAPRAERDFVFVAVGLVGPPAVMEKTDGDAQISTAGRPVSTMPQLRVTDLGGNAIKNGEVVLEVGSWGGSIDETSTRTSDEGTATITGWTLGAAPGENTLIARAGDASTIFTATGVAGPVTLTIVAGDSQSTAVGTFVPIAPQVLVTDAQDLPVAGVDVAFEVGHAVTKAAAPVSATGAGATVAIYTRAVKKKSVTEKTRYLHKDHLGSIVALSDEAGAIAERLSFAPPARDPLRYTARRRPPAARRSAWRLRRRRDRAQPRQRRRGSRAGRAGSSPGTARGSRACPACP